MQDVVLGEEPRRFPGQAHLLKLPVEGLPVGQQEGPNHQLGDGGGPLYLVPGPLVGYHRPPHAEEVNPLVLEKRYLFKGR
jgi:hypothetical protein